MQSIVDFRSACYCYIPPLPRAASAEGSKVLIKLKIQLKLISVLPIPPKSCIQIWCRSSHKCPDMDVHTATKIPFYAASESIGGHVSETRLRRWLRSVACSQDDEPLYKEIRSVLLSNLCSLGSLRIMTK